MPRLPQRRPPARPIPSGGSFFLAEIGRFVTAITSVLVDPGYKGHTQRRATGPQRDKREMTMNTRTQFAAALFALAIASAVALPSQAEARVNGWAIGAGIVGAGIIAGSIAAANAQPVYVAPAPRRCRWVDRFDRFGNYADTVKVCRY